MLKAAGVGEVVVARLGPDDVHEDAAAAAIATALAGEDVRVERAVHRPIEPLFARRPGSSSSIAPLSTG